MAITTNMGMDLPVPSVTLGPAWAAKDVAAFQVVDAHDHSPGKGPQIPSSGLAINADLTFAGNNATNLRSARLASQTAVLAVATDLGCVVNVNGDLYWNNGSGTPVQLTSGSSIVGTAGSITGLPSGSAGVAYTPSTGTYAFSQASNSAAIVDHGPLVIRDTAISALGITIRSPVSLAGAYSLTLPTALPAANNSLVARTTAGAESYVVADGSTVAVAAGTLGVVAGGIGTTQLAALGVTTAKIAALNVTRPKMEAVGQQVSSSSFAFSTLSNAMVDITNLTVTLTTSGRPVMVMAVPDNLATEPVNFSARMTTTGGTADCAVVIQIVRTGTSSAVTPIATLALTTGLAVAGSTSITWPVSALTHFVALAAGAYTFRAQMKCTAGHDANANNMRLVAWEL